MISSRLSGYVLFFIILGVVVLSSGCSENGNGGPNDSDGDEQADYSGMDDIMITSSAFEDGDKIPVKYTCDGQNINPPFEFKNLPNGTQSLVLIVTDPDAPSGDFVHWLVWNIAPDPAIDEDSVPGTVGRNSYGKASYNGPCPSSGTHGYVFRVIALDTDLDLPGGSRANEVEGAMQGHVLAEGQMVGMYARA